MPSEAEIRALVASVIDGVLSETSIDLSESVIDVSPGATGGPSPDGIASVAIGADHGGYRLKEFVAFRLRDRGHEVHDCGTDSEESVDYPDFAEAVAQKVASGECTLGIVIDGAGIGSAMVANKVPGIRAACCHDISSAINSREHNHANVLTLGAGLIGQNLAWQIVETWLDTPWSGGRHQRRVDKITDIDRRYGRGS